MLSDFLGPVGIGSQLKRGAAFHWVTLSMNVYIVAGCYAFERTIVRTRIDIDEKLLFQAMRAGGCKTKRATVEAGLRRLVRKKAYRDVLALRGKIHWEGATDAWRRSKGR